MSNPLSGHTSAAGMVASAQGLRDGDSLTSPSLTNIYEGLHGNGIFRLADGAYGDSTRNSVIEGNDGFVTSTAAGVVTVHGGFCVLDGALYVFGGGIGANTSFTIKSDTNFTAGTTLPANPSADSEVFAVIYLQGATGSESRVMYELGTPAVATSGTPLIPSQFLTDPSNKTASNHQTTVLAIIRFSINTSGVLSGAVIHDRRTYVRTSPMYLAPITKGAVNNRDAANAVNGVTNTIDSLFASTEAGSLTNTQIGALWQSHTPDGHGMLYYATHRGGNATSTHRLGPNEVSSIITTNTSFGFDEANMWLVNPNGGSAHATLTPSGTFPPGHVVEIRNISTANSFSAKFNAKTNNATAADVAIANGKYAKFAYDGSSVWHLLFLQA